MSQDTSEKEIYEEAKKRVKDKKGFYSHFGAYVVVNAVLIVIWALSGNGTNNKWFLWPLCIWGVFVLMNFLQVFVFRTSVQAEKRMIENEVARIKREKGS